MTSATMLAETLWRLAEEAERRGVKILHEPISNEQYALSGSDPTKLYRLTHWSCTCRGFMRWQRCGHWALFLAQLGRLPEIEPEPDPASPLPTLAPVATTEPCPDCQGRGRVVAYVGPEDEQGEADCRQCGGAGEVEAGATPSREDDPDPWQEAPYDAGSGRLSPVAVLPVSDTSRVARAVRCEDAEGQDGAMPAPVTFLSPVERGEAMAATVDVAIERLAEELAAGHTTRYLDLLAFYARFWRYSVPNTLLIRAQRPTATRVGGLKLWNSLGYHVAPGEKAIWILAPIIKRERDEESGEEVERCVGFRPCPVWDAAQLKEIEERPLPSLWTPLPDDMEETYQRVKERIEGTGLLVEERLLPGSIQGVSQGGRILVRAGLDSRNRLFTLLHELVHEVAHQGEEREAKPTEVREFEAESVTYVVAATLGLEHPTARDYVLSYHGSAEHLRTSITTVQRLVRQVLAIIGELESTAEPARAA